MIATVVAGAEDDGIAERAVMTTESSLIRLDPELAAAGVFPALVAGECRVSNEEELRGPEELAAARRLRSLLADLGPGRGGGPDSRADRELADQRRAAGALGELSRAQRR